MTYKFQGIEYKTPKVIVLDNTNMLFAEYFSRTAYDSFDKSENEEVRLLDEYLNEDSGDLGSLLEEIKNNDNPSSELMEQLSHVHFHKSTLEHIFFNISVKGISRALLQELARHRLASYTVRSTRYTMTDILHNFLCIYRYSDKEAVLDIFIEYILNNRNYFTVSSESYLRIEAMNMALRLIYQLEQIGYNSFKELIVPKSLLEEFDSAETFDDAMSILKKKSKRNIGDPFKHIISENISVDLGLSINASSLKNMFELRLSGSAWFQFQVLMNEIYKQIPSNYMRLINNGKLDSIQQSVEARINEGSF